LVLSTVLYPFHDRDWDDSGQSRKARGKRIDLTWRKVIPWSLVCFRALAGPVLALVAWKMATPQIWLGALIAAGFVSDVYDGVLARRWGTATAALRIADSATDIVFYLCILAAVVLRHGTVIRERLGLLGVVLALEAGRLVFDWFKFGRMASYHSYTAKAWGVLLAVATIALLCFDGAFWLVTVALAWGIVCDVEGLAMSLMLPEWAHDVKTLRRALILRQKMLAEREARVSM